MGKVVVGDQNEEEAVAVVVVRTEALMAVSNELSRNIVMENKRTI